MIHSGIGKRWATREDLLFRNAGFGATEHANFESESPSRWGTGDTMRLESVANGLAISWTNEGFALHRASVFPDDVSVSPAAHGVAMGVDTRTPVRRLRGRRPRAPRHRQRHAGRWAQREDAHLQTARRGGSHGNCPVWRLVAVPLAGSIRQVE